MEKEYKLKSFTLFTALTGTFFLFAAEQKIIGDSIAFVCFNNNLKGLQGLMPTIWILVISWILSGVFCFVVLPGIFRNDNFRTAVRIGVAESAILIPLITFGFSPSFVFGSMDFDFAQDYIDISRNTVLGVIGLVVMLKFGEKDSPQHKL